VENLMRVLSIEWARYGILLNAVAADTSGRTRSRRSTGGVRRRRRERRAARRVGEPEQIAWLVAYLASPAGDHTTGTVLTVDGGRDNHLGAWPPDGEPLVEVRVR